MIKQYQIFVGAVAVAAALAAPMRSADACSQAAPDLVDFPLQPANGANAPANTRVWIPLTGKESATDLGLFNSGIAVPSEATTIMVDNGNYTAALVVLSPRQALPIGASIELQRSGVRISQFTVTDAVPAATTPPSVDRIDVDGAYFGGLSCPSDSRVTVYAQPADRLVLVLDHDATTATLPTVIRGIGLGNAAVLDVDAGTQKFDIVSIDSAGQLSPPTALREVTVPAETSGCNSGNGSIGGLTLLIVALVPFARARRRNA
jgi:hypothetical protein